MVIQPFQRHFSAQTLIISCGDSFHLFIFQTITKLLKYIKIKYFCSMKDSLNSVKEQKTN